MSKGGLRESRWPDKAWRLLFAVALLTALMGLLVLVAKPAFNTSPGAVSRDSDSEDESANQAQLVGSRACAGCHAEAYRDWRGSHHQQAMQAATEPHVLGDFNDVSLKEGDGAVFTRKGDDFVVRTQGVSGRLQDFPVRYTFGVYPLQQYLLALPGGRLQAFTSAWDSRPAAQGGQRWFALYPQAQEHASGALHWTAIDQNWNANCSHCHSTGVRKNYRPNTRRYETQFAEISVGCEACHGPGSQHVAWANHTDTLAQSPAKGLKVWFGKQPLGQWRYDSEAEKVVGEGAGNHPLEVETCARCHGLGTPIDKPRAYGQPIGDSKRVALLDPALYFADGQIKGEVFEYGSFIQSRMYQAGVTCSNCHQPHTARLRAEGNAVCAQCHQSRRYDSPDHHHHQADSAGARCVACHMPSRTYMKVDVRHDHGFRVPRPDLSERLGTPNACNQCHQDRDPAWAAAAISSWPGGDYKGFQRFAEALSVARQGAPDTQQQLRGLIDQTAQPAIARASALAILTDLMPSNRQPDPLLARAARDPSPLVRRAAAGQASVAAELLDDPVKAVRITAAETLAPMLDATSTSPSALLLQAASREYRQAQALSADRPEAHLGLARWHAAQGQPQAAQKALETALELDPAFVPAAINLADFYRSRHQETQAGKVLRQALTQAPKAAALRYTLGLWKVRNGQRLAAVADLAVAWRQAPDNPQYAYVYALALHDGGDTSTAIEVLQTSLQQHPYHSPSRALLAQLSQTLR